MTQIVLNRDDIHKFDIIEISNHPAGFTLAYVGKKGSKKYRGYWRPTVPSMIRLQRHQLRIMKEMLAAELAVK